MRKLFFTLMLTLVSAIALQAQSLTGKEWYTKLADEDGKDVAVSLTFDADGTCVLFVGAEEEEKVDGVPVTYTGGVVVPGTYTLNGKDLTMDLYRSKAEVDLDYEIKGMDDKVKALMDQQIGAEVNKLKKEFKKVLLNGMPKMHNMKIVSLESKKLVLKLDIGADLPFYSD